MRNPHGRHLFLSSARSPCFGSAAVGILCDSDGFWLGFWARGFRWAASIFPLHRFCLFGHDPVGSYILNLMVTYLREEPGSVCTSNGYGDLPTVTNSYFWINRAESRVGVGTPHLGRKVQLLSLSVSPFSGSFTKRVKNRTLIALLREGSGALERRRPSTQKTTEDSANHIQAPTLVRCRYQQFTGFANLITKSGSRARVLARLKVVILIHRVPSRM